MVPGTFSSADQPGRPPSDAVVLFDGAGLEKWRTDKGQPAPWRIVDGCLQAEPGTGKILTKELIAVPGCTSSGPLRARSRQQPRAEGTAACYSGPARDQVLDSYQNVTYADGHAGAYYGINPPMALPVRPPGEFQVCDIVFFGVYQGRRVLDRGVTVFIKGRPCAGSQLEGAGDHRQRKAARSRRRARSPFKTMATRRGFGISGIGNCLRGLPRAAPMAI